MNTEVYKIKLLPNSGEANSTVFVLGSTGSGKTTLIANLLKERQRFVVIDSKKDYSPEFFGNLVKATGDLATFVSMLNDGNEKVVFNLFEHEEKEDILSAVCKIVFEFQLLNFADLSPLTIALDEMDSYVTSRNAPHGLEKIIKQGRSVKIQKVFGGLWFSDVPTWARDTFTEIYAFAHHDKNGLQRLEQFGFDPEQLRTLPKYVCAYLSNGETKTLRLVAE